MSAGKRGKLECRILGFEVPSPTPVLHQPQGHTDGSCGPADAAPGLARVSLGTSASTEPLTSGGGRQAQESMSVRVCR